MLKASSCESRRFLSAMGCGHSSALGANQFGLNKEKSRKQLIHGIALIEDLDGAAIGSDGAAYGVYARANRES